jgi:antitoxin component YwqK of YwqJK toxin-antitoxin module
MKSLIFIISSVFLTISCSKQIIISEDQLPEDTFYQSDKTTPYTGKCIVIFKGSEKVKEEMHFQQGILNGVWISYYENGNIARKGEYLNGMFHGKWESWSETGLKLYEVNYENDSLSGKYITWYKSGKLKEKGEYSANIRTGIWIYNDESGSAIEKKYNSLN